MIESRLGIESFLLKPVQRICRYPLLLRELLKCTAFEDPTYNGIKRALDAMKSMADEVNQSNRDREEVETIAERLIAWEGPALEMYAGSIYV